MIETSAMSKRAIDSWPTLQDVLDARPRIYAVMQRPPMLRHPLLEEWLGCETWVKHENHNPTGAFKIRGGLNLLAQLSPDERRRGVVSASSHSTPPALSTAPLMPASSPDSASSWPNSKNCVAC